MVDQNHVRRMVLVLLTDCRRMRRNSLNLEIRGNRHFNWMAHQPPMWIRSTEVEQCGLAATSAGISPRDVVPNLLQIARHAKFSSLLMRFTTTSEGAQF